MIGRVELDLRPGGGCVDREEDAGDEQDGGRRGDGAKRRERKLAHAEAESAGGDRSEGRAADGGRRKRPDEGAGAERRH